VSLVDTPTTTIVPNTTITPCPVGYTGTFCQTPLCNGVVNGCANGGTCSGTIQCFVLFSSKLNSVFVAPSVCTCTTGWTGPTCSTGKHCKILVRMHVC